MSETVEQKQTRLAKLNAQKQALLERAKAVQKRIERAESADKGKRRKQDDRTKLIVGVAVIYAARTNPQARAVLQEAVKKLPAKDQGFLLQESALWAEIIEEAKPVQPTTAIKPQ